MKIRWAVVVAPVLLARLIVTNDLLRVYFGGPPPDGRRLAGEKKGKVAAVYCRLLIPGDKKKKRERGAPRGVLSTWRKESKPGGRM